MSLSLPTEPQGDLPSMAAAKGRDRVSMGPADFACDGTRPGDEISAWMVPLPDPHRLLRAVSGQPERDAMLPVWARDLADLHAELIRHRLRPTSKRSEADDDGVRAEIDRIIGEVDTWAMKNVPRTKCARMHTHSLGEVISRIAMSSADAWWTVLHSRDECTRHRVWSQLAQALEGYSELLAEIRAKRLRLPEGGSRIGQAIV